MIFSKAEKNSVLTPPKHIAIIPDGNRRWAKERGLSVAEGHRKGSDVVMDVVEAASELGVKAVTFYTFSTENWKRSTLEVEALMLLLEEYLERETERMLARGVRLKTIGDLTPFSLRLKRCIEESKKNTAHGEAIDFILALNYGGRDELKRAFQKGLRDALEKGLKPEEVGEEAIGCYLDTAEWPDPELLIRTSGEMRVSNFLLWQLSYAEMVMTDTLWPDFTPRHLLDALLTLQSRQRRLGG